jgi:crotonobetainyl-CoA:carnitine CoA-transferase CaiB-like acyl-CoA transferase
VSSDTKPAAGGALAGVRVVELGEAVSAPFCARVLADLGADVVKVESPAGDPARGWQPLAADGSSALFAYLNAGKRSVKLSGDPAVDAGRLTGLLDAADVIVTNLPSEGERAWGCDLNRLLAAAGRAVVLRLSPFGMTGPWAGRRGEALSACAVGAISVILGEPGRPPLSLPYDLPALQAGLHGAAAAMTALLDRDRSGRRDIDVAESEVLAYYAGGMSRFILGAKGKWKRRGFERHGGIYPSGFYPCKDGFIFLATQTRAQWSGFLELMGDPEWAQENPIYRDGVAIGWKHADEVDVHFIPWLAQHTRRELTEMAKRANLVLGPINGAEDILGEDHLAARGFWAELELGETRLRIPGMGYRMLATPWRMGDVPALGGDDSNGGFREVASGGKSRTRRARVGTRPLSGYRAVEFGFNWAGPMVGQILADMGMEVIKVETEERLDFMRHWPHARSFFHNTNRGKRSVALNIKTDEGRALVRKLVAKSDLVFDNFAAGVMAKNGLGYDDLRREAPDIVALSMAMAGQCGPLAHLRGFATIATGFAGLEMAIGYPETGSTGLPVIGVGDANAAIQSVLAALAALWHRERTGEGQLIDLSQVEAAAALSGEPLARYQLCGEKIAPSGNAHPRMAPHGIYPARGEDRWVALAIASDGEWRTLVELLGAPAWASDESLATFERRRQRRREIDGHLSEWSRNRDRDELVADLGAAGLAAAPVLEIEEIHAWPQFVDRGIWQNAPSFEGKEDIVYRTPWHMSGAPREVPGGSPTVGQDDDFVLGEILGLAGDEIASLREAGVVG